MYVGCSSLCSGCILLLGVRREYGIPLKKEVSKWALKKRCAFLRLLRAAFLAWKLSHTIRSMKGRQEVDGWFKYLLMFLGRTFHYIYQFDFWSPLLWRLRRDLQVVWRNIPRGYSEGFSTASGRTRLVSLLSPFPPKDRQGFRQRNLYGTGTWARARPAAGSFPPLHILLPQQYALQFPVFVQPWGMLQRAVEQKCGFLFQKWHKL